jgi:hypothetical protein
MYAYELVVLLNQDSRLANRRKGNALDLLKTIGLLHGPICLVKGCNNAHHYFLTLEGKALIDKLLDVCESEVLASELQASIKAKTKLKRKKK